MGSFRPIVGTLHLHREYNFTEPLVETALKSLRHSCRSELTRQGISLLTCYSSGFHLHNLSGLELAAPAGRSFLPTSACRHAERTISCPPNWALACGL